MNRIISLFSALVVTVSLSGQQVLLTTSEKTNYESTSTYNDVISFINGLKTQSPHIRIETIGKTTEGRDLPLIILANPMPGTPSDLSDDKRIVVYIQANIHAGEVEGKEATMMFARDLLKETQPAALKNIIFLICPIFNADGNEKFSKENRTYQNGPVNGVGVRYNGQLLDLNRDAMKAESPEIQGVITNVLLKWDPAVVMDCHTTDGSYHIEPTTFTWMVNPSGDKSLIAYMSKKMVPTMSSTLLNKYKVENCFYGEFVDMLAPEKGWIFDASEPRYFTNYVGLRNRLAILNENYVYADFKSRVNGCYWLIRSLSDYLSEHRDEIRTLIKEADNRTIQRGQNPSVSDSFAIAYDVKPEPDPVTIKTFEAELAADVNGRRSYRRTERQKNVTVPYLIDYFPVKNVRFPFAYILNIIDPQVLRNLMFHGIRIEKLSATEKLIVERFKINDLKGSPRLNQGHYTDIINGEYLRDTVAFEAGTFFIRTSQPLANLAAYLLEPQTNDGLLTWNYFDKYLVPQWGGGFNPYPVYRVIERKEIKTMSFSKGLQ